MPHSVSLTAIRTDLCKRFSDLGTGVFRNRYGWYGSGSEPVITRCRIDNKSREKVCIGNW